MGSNKVYLLFKIGNKSKSNNHCTCISSKRLELAHACDPNSHFNEKNDNTLEFNLLDKNTSVIRFENVNCIEFIYERKSNKHPDVLLAITEYILANFSKLGQFVLRDPKFYCVGVIATTLNETERQKISGTTQDNLKLVQLYSIENHQKMLNTLTTHLPRIEFIHYYVLYTDRSATTSFNLNVFDNFPQFYFYVDKSFEHNPHFVIIDVCSENNGKRSCCYDTETEKAMTGDNTEFNSESSNQIESIIFEPNQCLQFNFYDPDVGIVAAFCNGDFLNLDYPIKEVFPILFEADY